MSKSKPMRMGEECRGLILDSLQRLKRNFPDRKCVYVLQDCLGNFQIWTGNGFKPEWVNTHLSEGGTLLELRVDLTGAIA